METVSIEEFLNKVSQHQSRLFSVALELDHIPEQKAYELEEIFDKLMQEHPELKENSWVHCSF